MGAIESTINRLRKFISEDEAGRRHDIDDAIFNAESIMTKLNFPDVSLLVSQHGGGYENIEFCSDSNRIYFVTVVWSFVDGTAPITTRDLACDEVERFAPTHALALIEFLEEAEHRLLKIA